MYGVLLVTGLDFVLKSFRENEEVMEGEEGLMDFRE